MAPSRAPHCADWRLTRAVSSCCAGSQLPQGKARTAGLGCACAEICAFTFGLRLSSEPNFSPRRRQSPPWPWNQPFLARLQIFFGRGENGDRVKGLFRITQIKIQKKRRVQVYQLQKSTISVNRMI
ncbi:uncharacterized protein ACOB8E_005401 isoform 1-T1 [Sarcophilus harrisii]